MAVSEWSKIELEHVEACPSSFLSLKYAGVTIESLGQIVTPTQVNCIMFTICPKLQMCLNQEWRGYFTTSSNSVTKTNCIILKCFLNCYNSSESLIH